MNKLQFAGLALLTVAMSCGDAVGPRRQLAKLQAAQQRWRAQHLHTYAFTLQRNCECLNADPLYVLVVSDMVAGTFDLETGAWVNPQLGETVDDLFGFVQNAIDDRAYLIRVEYDASKGFPTTIDYDGAARAVDDEISIRLSDVHPVAPPP